MQPASRTILVTGATGYIGGRLVPRFLEAGGGVRCLARNPSRLQGRPWIGQVELVAGDCLRAETLPAAMPGVEVAFYLVHSMAGGHDFEQRDVLAARKPHAILQFVRHRWQFGNNPPRQDPWNLDGPESPSERHRQQPEYDPTYTTDPAHGAVTGDHSNGLTPVGPWDASGQGAVIVEDFPGMLEADHAAFLQQGGFHLSGHEVSGPHTL